MRPEVEKKLLKISTALFYYIHFNYQKKIIIANYKFIKVIEFFLRETSK